MAAFVYVIGTGAGATAKTYVGWTVDPSARVDAHNSGRGANRSATGHAFDVKLDPPAKIPPGAKNTRIFVQSASCVYAFPNVTTSNNKIELFYEGAGPPGTN